MPLGVGVDHRGRPTRYRRPVSTSPVDVPRTGRSAPLTLHLVRHGRTRYNDEGLLQGWSDSELTETGRAGVLVTADHLRDVPFVAAWTSPSPRTRTTGDLLLSHHPGVLPTAHDGLREFHFGDFEARPESELYRTVPAAILFRDVLAGTFPGLPGGESGRSFLGRVAAAFGAIERAHPAGGDVLVVSHGITLVAYLALALDTPLRPLHNGSISTVTIGLDGRRTAGVVGHDPSGTGRPQPAVDLSAGRVRFDDAASWAVAEVAADTVTR